MRAKILYFYPQLSTFIQKDLDILKEKFDLRHQGFKATSKWKVILLFPRQFLFLMIHIWSAKVIISRFVGYHSYLPSLFGKIFGKPVVLILGGTESHYFPSINYGNFVKPLYGKFTKLSFKNASITVPVDESLILSDYTYDETVPSPQGYKAFVKGTTAISRVIHNGYDPEKFYIIPGLREENTFLTVASNFNGAEFYRKGIDMILAAASAYPEYKFTIIGDAESIPEPLPVNVNLQPAVHYSALIDIYNKHQFYFQLSMAEGFPNALCEAMLCGCIPIGSDVFAIPKIIGNTGFILKNKNPKQLVEIIDNAVHSKKEQLSKAARDRISQRFPLEKRKRELFELIESLAGN